MSKKTKSIYLDDLKQIGHIRIAEELLKEIDEIAASCNMSRSKLMRRTLEGMVHYMNDAQSFNKPNFFGQRPSLTVWLDEREQMHDMTEQVTNLHKQIVQAKTVEEKLNFITEQNLKVANMINLLHKNIST